LFHRYCPNKQRINRTRSAATAEPIALPVEGFPKVSVREKAKHANFSIKFVMAVGSIYVCEIFVRSVWRSGSRRTAVPLRRGGLPRWALVFP